MPQGRHVGREALECNGIIVEDTHLAGEEIAITKSVSASWEPATPSAARLAGSRPSSAPLPAVLKLQQQAGNAAVARRLQSGSHGEILPVQRAPVHAGIIKTDDPDNVSLPTAKNETDVQLTDQDAGTTTPSTLKAVRARSDYLDNGIDKIRTEATILSLTPKTMTLMYSSGRTVDIAVADIKLGKQIAALSFVKRDSVVWPLDAHGAIALDGENTPNIVLALLYANQQFAKNRQLREKIAWMVYSFAQAVQQLGHAADRVKAMGGEGDGGSGRRRRGGRLPREDSDEASARDRDRAKSAAKQKRPDEPAGPTGGGEVSQRFPTIEAAIGQLNGKATVVQQVDMQNSWWKGQGFTKVIYVTNEAGKQFTVAHNPRTGDYTPFHPSSSN